MPGYDRSLFEFARRSILDRGKLDARVTYVDISRSSMEIARERARIRRLNNIDWHHLSILDVASLNAAPFDLISCTGVLHHLPEPERGLEALRRILAPQGAMSLMLYGRAGRLAVYAGQELMQLVNDGVTDPRLRTQHARSVVQRLPETNWLLRGGEPGRALTELLDDDSNLNDVLLHEQDRAYSVLEIYDFLASAQLEFVDAVLKLQTTPHITSDKSIIMEIEVSRNAPDDSVFTLTGSPAISKNQVKTVTLVKDGQTLVLGGIYVVDKSRRQSRVPYLHSIPFLGLLFKSSEVSDSRKELLIFVTPRIVQTEPLAS